MDRRHPATPGEHSNADDHQAAHRRARARSYSQPIASPAPGPSSGGSHRPPDPFDFLDSQTQSFPHPQGPGASVITSSFPPFGTPDFDDDALLRSFLSMTDDHHHQGPHTQLHPFPHLPALSNADHMPPPAPPSIPQAMLQPPSQAQLAANPLLSQTFVAWLQYMQLQLHLQQQQQQQQQQRQQAPGASQLPPQLSQPHRPPPPQHQQPQQQAHQAHAPYAQAALAPPQQVIAPAYARSSPQHQVQAGPSNTPSPDAGGTDTDMDNPGMAEEKRRRNTAASARFRVKKKQWTLNLERSITDLSGRVEELEREAAELRRENGWLKEIVMLKSKRFGAPAPDIINEVNAASGSGVGPTSTPPKDSDVAESDDDENDPDDDEHASGTSGKGKEVQR